MSKIIIYQTTDGIAVIHPCDCGLTIENVAKKDVPIGAKYKIIDSSELPSSREFREAWTFDFTSDYDGIGGAL